ncbi:class I SAM-dependent methyltransferase [uncultured Kiloniella sp.]|uniref:class I SAM-dependent methyltransferase n=1 Tax=uncultured Kiloniella sp. TaxID=1133091 RepID=UPI00260E38D0|nr:class I SAM-dependent methyltransferase [uncultured Kiloniella sp.]
MNQQITYPYIVKILQNYISPNDKVLEIGCGAKQYREYLPKSEYYGLDLPQSSYVDEAPDYPCSAEDMPVENESFDCIFGVATFYLHGDPDRTFRECYRALKPGGRFIVFDYKQSLLKKIKTDKRYTHVQTWGASELSNRLSLAGFSEDGLQNISGMVDYWDYPSAVRLLVRSIKRLLGLEVSNWLIIYAEKK